MRESWSSSKLADWIRGNKKPYCLTAKGWDDWEKENKKKHPIRFWITDTLLDDIQDIIVWIPNKLYSVKYYIVNRWIDQSHALVAHSKHIKPGNWQDLDYRILHCIFDELVDFVEIEKAYSNYRWDEKKIKTLKWWQGGKWRTRTWRNAEAGIAHLKWEMTLNDAEFLDDSEKHNTKPTPQAVAAKEILDLYEWWVNVRPLRVDPMDASGWSEYCEGKSLSEMFDEDNRVDTTPMHDKMRELEKKYDDEDTEMLIRLIKIRGYLWT